MAELPLDDFPSREEFNTVKQIVLELYGTKDGQTCAVLHAPAPMNLTEDEMKEYRDLVVGQMKEHLANRSGIAIDDFDHLKLRWHYVE